MRWPSNEDPPRQVVYGVAEEVLAALRAEGAVTAPQRFTTLAVGVRPRSLNRILDKLCAAADVEVRLDTQIIAAHRDEGRIASLQVVDHAGVHELTVHAFVGATGEADLASFGGASVRRGNHGMVQSGSLGVCLGGVPSICPRRQGGSARGAGAGRRSCSLSRPCSRGCRSPGT